MCGIFGVVTAVGAEIDKARLRTLTRDLFVLSESRGQEASGLAMVTDGQIRVLKRATPAAKLLRSKEYRALWRTESDHRNGGGFAMIGHSRLVTNGVQTTHQNNQPVITHNTVGVHNGIVANVDDIWQRFPALQRQYEVDTEALLSLIRHFQASENSLAHAVRRSFQEIEGVANIAVVLEEFNELILATNNGSLYTATSPSNGSAGRQLTVFASEEYILRKILAGGRILPDTDLAIEHVVPNSGLLINLSCGAVQHFSLQRDTETLEHELNGARRTISDIAPGLSYRRAARPASAHGESDEAPPWLLDHYERNAERIAELDRCTRCVLPTTYPFIELDEDGVCNYCRHYQPFSFHGREALEKVVERYRRSDGKPDCLVALSGGRDSCNSLHYLTRELGLTPIAYTYDWGMVTDLARRNASRICAGLGLEHIIVSANIERKRTYIRKNVDAWLDKPDIGTVPLFMAGDKQFFWYAEQLKRKTGVELMVFAMNPLERTDFKHGFCGISGGGHNGLFFRLNWAKNLQIALYYARAYAKNRGYINSSLVDTAFAYFAYYVMPHNYTMFHDYIPWDEKEVEGVLDLYNWERSPDTRSTWRIGDGTAPLYNYIYYTIAGFTENDTFRSEQIRAGKMDRTVALERVNDENYPRWQSLKWYCDTIGIDVRRVIDAIHGVAKFYA
ncbi:MAG: hypothetical protein MJE77_36220 [Proteobacteria bacterium]|nr:hypothetical protein [Pseudomonadota bacterium]